MTEANQYFVARTTAQEGPFSLPELILRVDAGRYQGSELCWSKADGLWLPLQERSEVTAALSAFDREREAKTGERPKAEAQADVSIPRVETSAEVSSEPALEAPLGSGAQDEVPEALRKLSPEQIQVALRASVAWRRFIARTIDMNCAAFVFMIGVAIFAPQLIKESSLPMLVFYSSLTWPWIEGVMLARLGWTPGKRLLGLRVVRIDGAPLDVALGIQRGLSVWVFGQGMELMFLNLIAMLWGFKSYAQTGSNIWDRQCATRVEVLALSRARVALATGLIFFIAILAIFVVMAQLPRAT